MVLGRVRPLVTSISLWEGIKNFYFKHLLLILAGALSICSVIVIGASYCLSDNRSNFWSDLLLNLGPEVLGMAATIGLIDYLIARRDKREHIRSAKPMARALLITFKSLRAAYDSYMIGPYMPTPDAIERYRDALSQSDLIANRFSTLVDEQQPEISTKLSEYFVSAATHLVTIGQAAAAVRASAPNAADHIGRVRIEARLLFDITDDMSSQVVPIYELTTDLGVENNQ